MASDCQLRPSDGATVDIREEEAEQADLDARAKRVILTDESGNPINSSNPLNVDTELTLDGNVIIDNISVFATDISDSSTTSFGLVDALGHQQIDVLTMPPIIVSPGAISGRTFAYEDTSFETGESPRVLDVNTDLGRNSVDGYFVNDGSGNIKVEISNNGTNYGGQHTLQKGEVMDLRNIDIDSIRLTWVANTAYRVFVI